MIRPRVFRRSAVPPPSTWNDGTMERKAPPDGDQPGSVSPSVCVVSALKRYRARAAHADTPGGRFRVGKTIASRPWRWARRAFPKLKWQKPNKAGV